MPKPLTHESTGLSPFELEFGYQPRLPWDWSQKSDLSGLQPRESLNRAEAQQFLRRSHSAWKWAVQNIKLSQERQRTQANKSRREPDFGVGDEVWVINPSWVTERPSVKLDWKRRGPYKVIGLVGHSFKLDLPPSIKVHPVFHADKLRRYTRDPLPGQDPPRPDAIEVEGSLEYEVDSILASRVRYSKLEYQVSWKGWDRDPEWYPAANLKNSAKLLAQYHKDRPQEPPPTRLETWLITPDSESIPEHKDDNTPKWIPKQRVLQRPQRR